MNFRKLFAAAAFTFTLASANASQAALVTYDL